MYASRPVSRLRMEVPVIASSMQQSVLSRLVSSFAQPRAILRLASIPSLACILFASGCGSTARTSLTEAQLKELEAEDNAKFKEEYKAGIERVLLRIGERMDTFVPTPQEPELVIDMLAISGGGDYGAFGAGFLVGWANAPKPWERPDFDVVTGVSTGALIAPFAYVGTDEAYRKVESFYRNPKSDWVSMNAPFFFLPSHASFAEIPGLSRDLSGVINEDFAQQMADQSAQGKLLLVSATNLDLSRQRYWHLGPIATEGAKTGDLTPLRKRLLASSAIPVVFPPVEIDGFLYADGGVTANVLLRLDPKSPDGLIQTWRRVHPNRPMPKARFWIIINNQVHPAPETVQRRWPSIVSPALATSVRSGTMSEIRWLAAEAMYVNAQFGANIEVRTVAIPDDWRPPVKGDFQQKTMDSLATLGEKMGADPSSWTLWCDKAMSDTTDPTVVPPLAPTGLPRSESPAGTPANTPAK